MHAGGKDKTSIVSQEKLLTKKLVDIELLIDSRTEEAIIQLDGVIRSSIDQNLSGVLASAYLLTGRAYKKLGQPELAFHYLSLSSEQSPTFKIPEKGRIKEITISTSQSQMGYYLEMGEVLSQLGRLNESTHNYKLYQQQLNNSSESDRIDLAIAQNYFDQGEFKPAISLYEKLLTKQSDDLIINTCYSRLAACYISIGNTEKGLEFYRKSFLELPESIDRNSFNSNTQIVTNSLRKQNKFAEEIEARNYSLNYLNDGIEHLKLAQLFFDNGNFNEAESSLDSVWSEITGSLFGG